MHDQTEPQTRIVETFYGECPDCYPSEDRWRYVIGTERNGRGQLMTMFGCNEGHEPLADLDIDLEANETWEITVHPDNGREVLTIHVHEEIHEDEEDE